MDERDKSEKRRGAIGIGEGKGETVERERGRQEWKSERKGRDRKGRDRKSGGGGLKTSR